MKILPQITNDWSDLYQMIRSGTNSTLFLTAIELGIFDFLKAPVQSAHVAEKLDSDARNTELFLNALAGLDLIIKNNGKFSNTEKGMEFLATDSPLYLGRFFIHINEWGRSLKPNLINLIKNGSSENAIDMSDQGMWAESARISATYQYAGNAQYITEIVSSLPEFANMKSMLDLGGGSGFFTMSIVDAHPDMKGYIIEQPSVAKVAQEFIKEYNMTDRVFTIEGDYTTSNLEGPYDLIFASATLNFYKREMDNLFKRVYDSLNPGGVFITHQDGITDERTKPSCHISEFLVPELMGADFAIEQGAIAESMLRAGFKSVRSFTRKTNVGDMDIDIARK